jgi:hypothetical protein
MAIPGFGPRSVISRLRDILQAEIGRLRAIRQVSPAWLNDPFVSTEDLIIIGGCGRSGTTLLSVIINSSSTTCCGPEDPFLLPNRFSLEAIAKNYEYDPAWLMRKARQFENRGEFTEFWMRDQKQRHNVNRIAVKHPRYTLFLSSLFQQYPSARFLCMLRDGRDVALSLRKNEQYMGQRYDREYDDSGMLSMRHCAEVWRLYVNAFRPFESDPRCKLVRYEELITNPREVVNDLCEFLDVPFEESLLTFKKGAEGRNDLNDPHLLKIKSALDASHHSLWKHELTAEQVQEFERYAGRELVQAGYELSTGEEHRQVADCSSQALAH